MQSFYTLQLRQKIEARLAATQERLKKLNEEYQLEVQCHYDDGKIDSSINLARQGGNSATKLKLLDDIRRSDDDVRFYNELLKDCVEIENSIPKRSWLEIYKEMNY